MPDELPGCLERELGFQAQESALPQPGERALHDRRQRHQHEQRTQPRVQPADQDVVDEDARVRRHGDAGDHEREPGEHGEQQAGVRARHPRRERLQQRCTLPARLKVRAAREDERDAGKGLIEFFEWDNGRTARWIVQISAPTAESFEDDKVVEVPVDDRGQLDVAQLIGLFPEALRCETVAARRLENVAGFAAVTRDTTGDA